MTRLALAGCILALLSVAGAGVLWWLTGAWQHGGLSTGGLVRAVLFGLAALACHGTATYLRRRG